MPAQHILENIKVTCGGGLRLSGIACVLSCRVRFFAIRFQAYGTVAYRGGAYDTERKWKRYSLCGGESVRCPPGS